MIQRIQSLHLLAATLLAGIPLFAPMAHFINSEEAYTLYAFTLRSSSATTPTFYMGILLALACALPFVTIFLFRNRMLQIRLCVVEAILLLGAAGMEAIYCHLSHRLAAAAGPCTAGYHFAVLALPLIAILFVWLAARAIFRDELLVKASDRIR